MALFAKASKAYRTSSPWFSWTWQPPLFENLPFTISPQNWDEVADSLATRVTMKSLKSWNQSASQLTPFARAASSSAAVGVGTGEGYAPALVPSQGCVPPDGVVTSWPSLVTGTSRMVVLAPSARTVTPTGAAGAAGAATRESRSNAAESAVLRRRSDIEPPLPRGSCGLSAGVRSPGFELRAAPSRRAVGSPVATCDASAPVHSGGTARDSHPTSLDHRPLNAEQHTPPRSTPAPCAQTPSRPLESLAAPPSSRGLGRRPLTAETGVRIPVAVLLPERPAPSPSLLPRPRPRQPARQSPERPTDSCRGRLGHHPGVVRDRGE